MTVWIPEWALPELATFFITVDLERSLGVEVRHDAKLDSILADRELRQVDVAVRYKHATLDFLEIIEIEDRRAPFGNEGVDELLGKAHAVGANAATIVATAGFTRPALKRIDATSHPIKLKAVHLSGPTKEELDPAIVEKLATIPAQDDTRGSSLSPIILTPLAYRNASSGKSVRFMFMGHVVESYGEYLVCLSFPPPLGNSLDLTVRIFTKAGSKRTMSRFTVVEPSRELTLRWTDRSVSMGRSRRTRDDEDE